MECGISNKNDPSKFEPKLPDSFASTDFQKFIYELFDKNGVLNDLRAYLRGHIVDVLKNSEIGNRTKCEQLFTQRLALQFQAINILITEYLQQQKFKYTLSVFLTEIPLSNMAFNFSKLLMQNKIDIDKELLRFTKSDVWNIISHLGVQCNSMGAEYILSTYQSKEKPSLLECLLKNISISNQLPSTSTEIELSGSSGSSILTDSSAHHSCNHNTTCKLCRDYIKCIKIRYRTKIKEVNQILDEMQLVYKSEIEIIKDKERDRSKLSITAHSAELQKKYTELEEQSFRRQKELEASIKEKKKFLWTLAKSLRLQQEHLSRAFNSIKLEGERLNNKEENLKKQLKDAEQVLTMSGEEMRQQITNELNTLETHLHEIRCERDRVTKERNELLELKKPQKVLEDKSTITDIQDINAKLNLVFNNSEKEYEKTKMTNCLKRNKNINYEYPMGNKSSDIIMNTAEDTLRDTIKNLQDENLRLRTFNTQQSAHISELCALQAKLQADLCATRYSMQNIIPQMPMYTAERINMAALSSHHCNIPMVLESQTNIPQGILENKGVPVKEMQKEMNEQEYHVSRDFDNVKPLQVYNIKNIEKKIPVTEVNTSETLKEARLRLRKLEIEAEAVEKSYMEFRKRRNVNPIVKLDHDLLQQKHSIQDFRAQIVTDLPTKDKTRTVTPSNNQKKDVDKYLKVYSAYDTDSNYFKRKITTARDTKPIAQSVLKVNDTYENLIETPIKEFRKYYNSKHRPLSKNTLRRRNRKHDQALSPIRTYKYNKRNKVSHSHETFNIKDKSVIGFNEAALTSDHTSKVDAKLLPNNELNDDLSEKITLSQAESQNKTYFDEDDILEVDKSEAKDEGTNNIIVLVENPIENITIPRLKNGSLEMTILITPEISDETLNGSPGGNLESEDENLDKIKVSEQEISKENASSAKIHKDENKENDEMLINKLSKLLDRNINIDKTAKEDFNEIKDVDSIENETISTKDSFDCSIDVDNYNSYRSDGMYSPASIAKSMDNDDLFWDN